MKFNSLKEALQFQTNCLFCEKELTVDSKNTSGYNDRFRFVISSSSDEAFIVDKETENVILVKDVKLSPSKRKSLNFNGQFWTSMHIDCEDCGRFSYVLQLKFDIDRLSLVDVELNAMSVTFEENDLVSEIRNLYSLEETWLITYNSSGDTKATKLPLIQIDLGDPEKTLARVRKLVVYS